MAKKTILGKLAHDYMEKVNILNGDNEKYDALRSLFINIFDRIKAGDDGLKSEFKTMLIDKPIGICEYCCTIF